MPAPTMNLPVSGVSPQITAREAVVQGVDAVSAALFDAIQAQGGKTAAQPYATHAAAVADLGAIAAQAVVYIVTDETRSGVAAWYQKVGVALVHLRDDDGIGTMSTQVIAADGRSGTYPLRAVPADMTWLGVWVDGIKQTRGLNYQIDLDASAASGYGLQFFAAETGQRPETGNRIVVEYPLRMAAQAQPLPDDWSAASIARRKFWDRLQVEGIAQKMDEVFLIGRDAEQSRVAVVNPAHELTPVGTDWRIFPRQAFCANHGQNTDYLGGDENGDDVNGDVPNGTSYFRTGFVPAQAERMRADDAHMSIFIVEPGLFADGLSYRGTPRTNVSPAIGSRSLTGAGTNETALIKFRPVAFDSSVYFRLNTDADISIGTQTTHVGMFTVTRAGAEARAYHNGALLGTAACSGAVLSPDEVVLGAHFDSGAPEFGDYPFSLLTFGACLTDAEAATLNRLARDYLLEIGAILETVAPGHYESRHRSFAVPPDAALDLTRENPLTTYTRSGQTARINRAGYWEAVAADTQSVDHDPLWRTVRGFRSYDAFTQIEPDSGDLTDADFVLINATRAVDGELQSPYGAVGGTAVVRISETVATGQHGVARTYANASIDDFVGFDVHVRPANVSSPVRQAGGILIEVVGRDGAVQGWAWYHWSHDRIEQTGGGAFNAELTRWHDGLRRVFVAVPAGTGAGDVTCRVLAVDRAADYTVIGKPSVSFAGDVSTGFVLCGWQVITDGAAPKVYSRPYLETSGGPASVGDQYARFDAPLPLSGQKLHVFARFEQQGGGEAGAQIWRAYNASDDTVGRLRQENADFGLGVSLDFVGEAAQAVFNGERGRAFTDCRVVGGRDALSGRFLIGCNNTDLDFRSPATGIAASDPITYFMIGSDRSSNFVFRGWIKELHAWQTDVLLNDLRVFTGKEDLGTLQPARNPPLSALSKPWIPNPRLVPVVAGVEPPWLAVARNEIGAHSWNDDDNPDITKYFRSALNTSEYIAQFDSTAFCAAGANWCLQQVGLAGTKDIWAFGFNYYGVGLSEYIPGAILTIANAGQRSIRHVTFCVEDLGSYVKTLGFNQGGHLKVNYAVFSKADVYAIRWPVLPE